MRLRAYELRWFRSWRRAPARASAPTAQPGRPEQRGRIAPRQRWGEGVSTPGLGRGSGEDEMRSRRHRQDRSRTTNIPLMQELLPSVAYKRSRDESRSREPWTLDRVQAPLPAIAGVKHSPRAPDLVLQMMFMHLGGPLPGIRSRRPWTSPRSKVNPAATARAPTAHRLLRAIPGGPLPRWRRRPSRPGGTCCRSRW